MAQKSSSRVKAIVFLLIGVIALLFLGVFFVSLLQTYSKQMASAQQREATTYVIVAYTDLYQGVTIMEKDLFAVEIPPKHLFKNGSTEAGFFKSPEHVVGRVPRERILANEYIRKERLADKSSGTGLNALIPRNMRAISVAIGGGRALGEFLHPGNFVDIMVTLTPQLDDSGSVETHTMLQSVRVLAVDDYHGGMSASERRRNGATSTVTLSVTPSQAERIAYAKSVGTLTLLLRNDTDNETTENPVGVGIDDILPPDQEKPALKVIQTVAPVVTDTGPKICNGADCGSSFGGFN